MEIMPYVGAAFHLWDRYHFYFLMIFRYQVLFYSNITITQSLNNSMSANMISHYYYITILLYHYYYYCYHYYYHCYYYSITTSAAF